MSLSQDIHNPWAWERVSLVWDVSKEGQRRHAPFLVSGETRLHDMARIQTA